MGADYRIGVDVFAPVFRSSLGVADILVAVETLVQHAGGGDLDADCLIIPDLVGASYVRLARYEELIKAGRQAAQEMLPTIQAALGEDFKLARPSITVPTHL